MALDLQKEKGIPLERQSFTWRELVQPPISKLNDDAFTRVRVILMNGIECGALRLGHACARMNADLRVPLAQLRRVEQHQQTMVNWLLSADHSPLDTTIGFEQVAIEVTASVAQHEPDPYLAQIYRFGMLEDFDHMYRFSALMDRLTGQDANNILQCYTDILPGRPTSVEHRAPEDDVRAPYDKRAAQPLSKLHAATITDAEHQTHDYYMTIGPMFSDPLARQLYAEIASIEEQHVTQYESLQDPSETWLEKLLVHEATEVWNYLACVTYEGNARVKAIWQRFLDYELGHLQTAMQLFQRIERRDPFEVIPTSLPELIDYKSHRAFVRQVLRDEVGLRAHGTQIVKGEPAGSRSKAYRDAMNADGSPSESVALGYRWSPGTELADGGARKLEARP